MSEIPVHDLLDVRHHNPADALGHQGPMYILEEAKGFIAVQVFQHVRRVDDRQRSVRIPEPMTQVAIPDLARPMPDLDPEQPRSGARQPPVSGEPRLPRSVDVDPGAGIGRARAGVDHRPGRHGRHADFTAST
jgi:hypothetical protein